MNTGLGSIGTFGTALATTLLALACSGNGSPDGSTGGQTSNGGSTSSGGSGLGGSQASGGNSLSGGTSSTGGATGAGGNATSGGAAGSGTTGGQASGGGIATGGAQASGGSSGAGAAAGGGAGTSGNGGAGASATGGNSGAGGSSGASGSSGSGGTATGGSAGSAGNGGASGSGGSVATGGSAGSGGAGTGPVAGVSVFPPNGSANMCGDAILSITFSKPAVLNASGKVQIFNAASPGTAVETIEAPTTLITRTISGESFKMYPMTVVGNTAFVLVRAGALQYGQTYYVTVDAGLITDSDGKAFSVTGTNAWRFTTKATKPAASATSFSIAADGSGDFCTVMGAIDTIPAGNTTPRTLSIKNGEYPGLVDINGKSNILLRGEDRIKTSLSHRNTEAMNTNKSFRMAYKLKQANDIVFENLTITNTTPAGGSGVQAEAITIEGSSKRVILNNIELKSYQDTFMADAGTQVYVKNSRIWGDTDFLWGGGTVYCDGCELTTRESGHSITNARTAAGVNGFAFVNCKVTREATSIGTTTLGQTHDELNGNVAYINCRMDEHITGWKDLANRDWEYGNTNLDGSAPKKFNAIQLTAGSPELALTSSAETWLGWKPVLPN